MPLPIPVLPPPHPIPPEVLAELIAYESERLSVPREDTGFDGSYGAYFPDWCSSSPGYHGPLVIISWSAGVDAVTTYYKKDGHWTLGGQSTW